MGYLMIAIAVILGAMIYFYYNPIHRYRRAEISADGKKHVIFFRVANDVTGEFGGERKRLLCFVLKNDEKTLYTKFAVIAAFSFADASKKALKREFREYGLGLALPNGFLRDIITDDDPVRKNNRLLEVVAQLELLFTEGVR